MKSRLWILAFVLVPVLWACGGDADDAIDEDGEFDSFLDGGKVDTAGITEGSQTAIGVLKVANETSKAILAAKSGVNLGSKTAGSIVKARAGKDGKEGTSDDVKFTTLVQLDAVSYVGPAAFAKMVTYAQTMGFIADSTNPMSGQATRMPWSGYWWSMLNAELALGWDDGKGRKVWSENEARAFDKCLESYSVSCIALIKDMAGDQGKQLSPLMKFDYFVRMMLEAQFGAGHAPTGYFTHSTRWELDNHYIGDNTEHPYWDARGYSGKCIGWALATMFYDEPTTEKVIGDVLFKPADIKGFLASIFNGAQFFVPEDKVLGNEYRDQEGSNLPEYREDVYPQDFVRALFETIGKGTILEGDLEPDTGVWNYPIHRYEMSYTKKTSTLLNVTATIWYANDEVDIDFVSANDPDRSDILSRELTFELDVPADFNGDLTKATGGRWTGESVDTHPDALIMALEEGWRTTIYEYKNTSMNTEVNYPLIKRLQNANGKWTPIIDDVFAKYYAK